MILCVKPEDAVKLWPVLSPLFEKCTRLTHGAYEPADVLEEIKRGEQLLWCAFDEERQKIDAVMTTAIVDYPHLRVCRVIYISGSRMASWLKAFVEAVERYCTHNKCGGIEGFVREGWARAWPGAKKTGVSLFKDLR